MKNMFVYTHKEPIQPKEGDTEIKYEISKRYFNINKVVSCYFVEEENKLAVVLDDFHERIEEVPVRNAKGTITAYKNKPYIHQTFFYLEGEDMERYINLTVI